MGGKGREEGEERDKERVKGREERERGGEEGEARVRDKRVFTDNW